MLKPWQRWAYFSQWTIALGAALQCWQTSYWLNLPATNAWLIIFCFCSTLLFYLFHFRFYKKKKPANDRQLFFEEQRPLLSIQFVVFSLLLVVSLFFTGIHFIVPIVLLALCAAAYTYFILKPRRYGIFRYNGIFKILTLTVVWTAVTNILPVVVSGENILQPAYLLFYFFRWLFMLAICLPFDVRDMKQDERSGQLTIPVLIGQKTTFRLCYLLLFLHALLPFAGIAAGWYNVKILWANIPATVLTIWCTWYSSKHTRDDFSWFLLDSNFILRAAIIAVALIL